MQATARARANIALAKYWGKSDDALALPAVPSISVTLDPLVTETTVRFDGSIARDELVLDGEPASEHERARVERLLDRVRAEARTGSFAHVASRNAFPTAAGLASSASGFAALAAAARAAAGLAFDRTAVSRLARASSVSAARSAFSGFVELPAARPGEDALAATQLAEADHWKVNVVVALTEAGRKAVGSSEGMRRTRETSPYYAAWVALAPALAAEVRAGVLARDLERVGSAMERSTLAFHAAGMAATPPIVYLRPATLSALDRVRTLRESGIGAWATMDAGPHVKALCLAADGGRIERALAELPGIRTFLASPGPGVELITPGEG